MGAPSFFANLLDDTHTATRDACRRFALREIAPHAAEWEEAEAFPRELYRRAAEAGVLGVGFREEHGGAGGGPLHTVMAIEGMMAGGSTGVSVGLGSLGIALPAIVQAGDPSQIARFVMPALRGDKIGALGITEPGTGSDVAGIRTRAVRDGDHFVVSGAKLYITSGVRADFVTTLVRTSAIDGDPHAGLSFLVIERGTPGFTVSRALKKIPDDIFKSEEVLRYDGKVISELCWWLDSRFRSANWRGHGWRFRPGEAALVREIDKCLKDDLSKG